MNRCLGTKRDNSPCTVTVEPPQTYCWWHDPANADKRKQAAARGGKRAGRGRPQAELANIKQRLSDLAEDVLAGELETARAAVANQLINTRLRAIELERKIREADELEMRIAALEREGSVGKGGRVWGA
jgi:hypothetical protein